VRKDLSPSQQAVQAIHAALEASKQLSLSWNDHPHLALCGVNSLLQLQQAAAKLSDAGIQFTLWHEPDRGNEPTALATTILTGEVRRYLRKFQLLSL
jgi:hypothetical protein